MTDVSLKSKQSIAEIHLAKYEEFNKSYLIFNLESHRHK